jgi:hypothetical protein
MKKVYFLIMVLLAIFFSACSTTQKQPVCNSPYILVGTSCCLDQNSNNVCDNDETIVPPTPKEFCGDGKCQTDESFSSCPEDCESSPEKTIGIRAFDYDKNEKKITVLQIEDPNYHPDWTLNAKGYGKDSDLKFEKEVTLDCWGFSSGDSGSGARGCINGCTGCHVTEEIPYLAGGTLSIKAVSGDGTIQAVEDFPYSMFEGDVSFSISYDYFDNIEEEVVYKLTNTGKRIIPYDITHYLFHGEDCGSTSMNGGWFMMIYIDLDKKGDGIVKPGEIVEARGSSHYDLSSGNTYCSKLKYGFDDDEFKEIIFTVD